MYLRGFWFGEIAPHLYMKLCSFEDGIEKAHNCYKLAKLYVNAGILMRLKPTITPECPQCSNRNPDTLRIDEVAEAMKRDDYLTCEVCTTTFGYDMKKLFPNEDWDTIETQSIN